MDSIILADGSFAYTLVHTKDSPFRLQPRPRSLISVKGQISGKKLKSPIPVREIAFMDDPRIIIIPLYLDPQKLVETTDLEIFSAPQTHTSFRKRWLSTPRKVVLGRLISFATKRMPVTSKLNIPTLPF